MTDPDILSIQISIAICLAAYLVLLWLLRRNSVSLGLPFAYLSLLLLNHVPGAYVQLADTMFMGHRHEVALGIRLTAIGSVFFVVGVWLARVYTAEARINPVQRTCVSRFEEDRSFWWFCVISGWIFAFGLAPLRHLPTVGAVIYNGGAIWMVGALLGLRSAMQQRNRLWTMIWFGVVAAYVTLILLLTGFLSYGTAAAIIVLSGLAISGRRYWGVVLTLVLTIYLSLCLFSSYFQTRDAIRDVVWGGGSIEKRLLVSSKIFTQFKLFDGTDPIVLVGFDLRLNQNYFVGLAKENLDNGSVDFLDGKSVTDALLSLVPRALWPQKTVYGGSPEVIAKMTGLWLSPDTSWGVGNVMEFYINFAMPGLIIGFIILGWLIGYFDHRAALAETKRDYRTMLLFFLPCVALIQPLGSMVELSGSTGAAWLAALFWNWAWEHWGKRGGDRPVPAGHEAPD